MSQELWCGVGPHPDQVEEEGYAERCAETFRQILRDEHKDHFEDEPSWDWWTQEDEELAEQVGLGEFEEH